MEEKIAETTHVETAAEGSVVPALLNAMPDSQKINLTKFDEGQRQKINQIVATASGGLSSTYVDSFGVEPQQRFNGLLDQLLAGIKTGEAGIAGELSVELAKQIKKMDLPKMKEEAEHGGSAIEKIPVLGKIASAFHSFKLAHQEILKNINEIQEKATRRRGELLAINSKLDRLAEDSMQNLGDLEIYLAAGQAVLLRAKAEFVKHRDEIATSKDPIALARLRDSVEQINAFEARLMRMHVAFGRSVTAIPEIRMSQEASRIEARDILDTLLYDLPELKSAILRVAALNNIIRASKENEARKEITRQIGSIGADALDEAYTRAKQSQGTGAEDVAALAATADRILETIEKGARFDQENREKREAAQKQLDEIKTKFVEGLRANAQAVVDQMA